MRTKHLYAVDFRVKLVMFNMVYFKIPIGYKAHEEALKYFY